MVMVMVVGVGMNVDVDVVVVCERHGMRGDRTDVLCVPQVKKKNIVTTTCAFSAWCWAVAIKVVGR